MKRMPSPHYHLTKNPAAEEKKKPSEYKAKYREIEVIGKGTSGIVYLVKSKIDKKFYISKKIILTNLNESERFAVEQEMQLLKRLRHPHIVGYVESFTEVYYMICIMEYCEQGDLTFHIRQKQKENDFFPERVILNWFVQLTMAINFIHEKNVLHRDIKCSNIFLTSNGSIKIGDFGISKVLKSSSDNAQTLVGTPFYLSPEVCENKPYTFQSDIWALGCVLFEICSLRHPFSSESLIALVVKIIKEPNPNIPPFYSTDLQNLTQILLAKKPDNRPSTKIIMQFPIVVDTMKDFVSSKGLKNELKNLPIKKTQLHLQKEKKNIIQKPSPISSSKGNISTPKLKEIPIQNSPASQTPKQVNKKQPPIRKSSPEIRAMEEQIQRQMKDVKNEVQKRISEVNQKKLPPESPNVQKIPQVINKIQGNEPQTPNSIQNQKQKSQLQQKQVIIPQKQSSSTHQPSSRNNSGSRYSLKQSPTPSKKSNQTQDPLQHQANSQQQQQLPTPSHNRKNSNNSEYDRKIKEMMSNMQNKVKQEYEQIKRESPNKESISKTNQKQTNIIFPQKSDVDFKQQNSIQIQTKSHSNQKQSNPIIEEEIVFDNQADKSQLTSFKGQNTLFQDSNVSLNFSLTNDSVFNQTEFKSQLAKGIEIQRSNSKDWQNIEEQIDYTNTCLIQKNDSEYRNEFLDSDPNKLSELAKVQTCVSEHIQTQQIKSISLSRNKNLNSEIQVEKKINNEDSFDIDDLPQREDYIDSDDDGEYEEDFDVSSEEETESSQPKDDFRLTRKNYKELDEVLEMYKSQLVLSQGPEEYNKFKHMLNMSEIIERSDEFSTGEFKDKLKKEIPQPSIFTKK